ncbi:hypothetical protein DNO_0840 [Dichelobacter nodosus VCS1703A]|uniref:Uncharacterized protein n=1 Tax=Dichelobacter nodosus (strain VCS1703A) TaxID=246195 RepID=A5EYE0_DICNV|nr:hypothetical protein DNO_0840 [Dichelobacter nodosus VCS1703A]
MSRHKGIRHEINPFSFRTKSSRFYSSNRMVDTTCHQRVICFAFIIFSDDAGNGINHLRAGNSLFSVIY